MTLEQCQLLNSFDILRNCRLEIKWMEFDFSSFQNPPVLHHLSITYNEFDLRIEINFLLL